MKIDTGIIGHVLGLLFALIYIGKKNIVLALNEYRAKSNDLYAMKKQIKFFSTKSVILTNRETIEDIQTKVEGEVYIATRNRMIKSINVMTEKMKVNRRVALSVSLIESAHMLAESIGSDPGLNNYIKSKRLSFYTSLISN